MKLLLFLTLLTLSWKVGRCAAYPERDFHTWQDFFAGQHWINWLNLESLSGQCQNQTKLLQKLDPVSTLTDNYWSFKSKIILKFFTGISETV
jgi:hypothetical protein